MWLMASKEIVDQRKSLCDTCENRSKMNICSLCSCFIPMKVEFAASSCPINKWDKVGHGDIKDADGNVIETISKQLPL
jgi:hypothetical protein